MELSKPDRNWFTTKGCDGFFHMLPQNKSKQKVTLVVCSQKKKTELLSKQQLVFVFKDFKFARANKKPKLVCQQSTCHRPKLLQIRNVFQTYTNSIKCQNAPSLSKSVN